MAKGYAKGYSHKLAERYSHKLAERYSHKLAARAYKSRESCLHHKASRLEPNLIIMSKRDRSLRTSSLRF